MSLLLALQGGGVDVTVSVTGNLITAATGSPTVTGGATVNATGNALTAASGIPAVTGNADVLASGSALVLASGVVQIDVTVAAAAIAGRPRRRPLLYRIWVEGKAFVFDNTASLIAFLEREELKQERRAEARAERHAKRIAKVGIAAVRQEPPRLAMRSEMPEIANYIAQLQSKIDRVYWAKLGEFLSGDAEEEEDIAILASTLDL